MSASANQTIRPMHSACYVGTVRHRRRAPVTHSFTYPLFMVYLDLGECDRVFNRSAWWGMRKPAMARLMRRDYLGPHHLSIDEAVRQRVTANTGVRPQGPIRMLTHLRYGGHCFNPVSFYYCFDPSGQRVTTIVAEITNTPWGERHAYVLPARDPARLNFAFPKAFHVSPFHSMDQIYQWSFNQPGSHLAVHMINREQGAVVFDATLRLRRRPMSRRQQFLMLLRFPIITLGIVARIHLQALRLWWKRATFYPHPAATPAVRGTP